MTCRGASSSGETLARGGSRAPRRRAVLPVMSVLVMLAAPLAGHGATAQNNDSTERTRLSAERADVNARFEAQAAECRRRFVVTACLNDAQRAQREALDGLRRQQLLLDEAQRKRRAADRMEAIRSKQPAADAPASSGRRLPSPPKPATTMRLRHQPSDEPAVAPPRAAVVPPPANAAPPAPSGNPRVDQSDGSAAARRSDLERARVRRQQEQQVRQAEMAAHRRAVEQRNAERAQGGKQPAAPLPVPSAGGNGS